MIRGIVLSIAEGVIKRFTASGRSDETISDREYFQHYGYTSRPKAGAEIIIIREGGHFVAVASDDRRYRIAMEEGEVSLYDDLGQKAHLTRSGIEVTSPLQITATAPEVTVVASTKVTITTPLLDVSRDVTVGGDVTVTGDVAGANVAAVTAMTAATVSASTSIADPTGTMDGMRDTYNTHTHPENGTGGGTTSQPNQGM